MKLIVVYFLLLIIPIALYSNDFTDIYPIDTLQSTLRFSDLDSNEVMFINSIHGSIDYINGKLERGRFKIPIMADSLTIDFTGDTATYFIEPACDCGDTLSIAIERTFQNALAKKTEPNYTAISKVCFRGFEYSVVFPMRVEPSEKEIKINAVFKMSLNQIFTKLIIADNDFSEFNTELEIMLKTEKIE